MHNNYQTLVLIMLFAIAFAAIGWVAPALYATYAPADHFIESDSFETPNATTSQDTHTVCFDRTVNRESAGEVFTELYIITEDGERIEIQSQKEEKFFQQRRLIIRIDVDLPDKINAGKYRYERVYNMETANGRVDRRFSFTSDKFTIINETGTVSYDIPC